MKLGEENTFVACVLDENLKHRRLIGEVILPAHEASHATICVFPRTDRAALCAHLPNIESMLFENLLKPFGLAIGQGHLLQFTMMFDHWIRFWDDCVMLSSLLPTIRFVHLKCFQPIRWQGCMSGRLVKNKESNAVWMSNLKNPNGTFDLLQQLFSVPPCIAIGTRIDNFSGLLNNLSLLVAVCQASIFSIDESGNMNDAASPLFLQKLLTRQ